MSLADSQINQNNRSLGITPNPAALYKISVMGTCSGVAAGSRLDVNSQNVSAAGIGPAANAAVMFLNKGQPVVSIFGAAPLASEILSAVTVVVTRAVGTPSTGTITIGGTPADSGLLRIECVTTGATNSNAVIRYSWDDGISWVETVTGAATYLLKMRSGQNSVSSGLTITLTVGTYNAGDSFSLGVFAPQIDTTDANTGSIANCATSIANAGNYDVIMIANTPNQSAVDATNFSAVSAMATKVIGIIGTYFSADVLWKVLVNTPRMSTLGVETGATFLANLSSLASAVSDRLAIGIGYGLQNSNGTYLAWLPSSYFALGRQIENNNPSRSIYELNPLPVIAPGIMTAVANTLLNYTGLLQYGVTYDERLTVSGNSGYAGPLGFLAMTSDRSGPEPIESTFYFAAGKAHASPSSDYFEWQRSFLADVFLDIVMEGLSLKKGFIYFAAKQASPTKPLGALRDNDAAAIENSIDDLVIQKMCDKGWLPPPAAGEKFITVSRTANFIATETLQCTVGFAAPGWVNGFVLNFAFSYAAGA